VHRWVTLLAMSALPSSIRSLFHMLGAIGRCIDG
jgi:hypothetical protein